MNKNSFPYAPSNSVNYDAVLTSLQSLRDRSGRFEVSDAATPGALWLETEDAKGNYRGIFLTRADVADLVTVLSDAMTKAEIAEKFALR